MTNVIIEKKATNFEIHLNVKLTVTDHTNVYSNPYVPESDHFHFDLTPVGRAIMDGLQPIPGLGAVMCSTYSFQFTMALAFNGADILLQMLEVIKNVTGEDINLQAQAFWYAPAKDIGAPSIEAARAAIAELQA